MKSSAITTALRTVLLGGLAGGVLDAQAPIPSFGVRTEMVILSATAVDEKGRPIRDLKATELNILEEGRAQKLLRFSQAVDLPCRVLLLVDASGSMTPKTSAASVDARRAALEIVTALSPQDEVALAGFDSRYFGVVAFTRDREKLGKGFDELLPFGSTALHDALDKAAYDISTHGEGRRAVIVITDGVDTASEKTPDEVVARSRALDVPIYALSIVSPLDDPDSPIYTGRERSTAHDVGRELLARYAGLSGGAAFTVSDVRGLYRAAASIAGELKHQYRLGFDPPAGPPRFRRIEVRTTRKGVFIRTRSGYVPHS